MIVDIDLFGGPGGIDEGRRLAGHDDVPVLGVEWEPWACRTAAAAGHPRVRADVAAFPTAHLRGRVRTLAGAPPCPTFSNAGKGAGRVALDLFVWGVARMLAGDDVRAEVRARHERLLKDAAGEVADLERAEREATDAALVLEPARWIHDTEPGAVLLEQVPGVLPVWQALGAELRRRGWSTWAGVLNAADYGVPQTRERAVLLASRAARITPPPVSHAERPVADLFGDEAEPWMSMVDAVGWDGIVGFPRRDDGGAGGATEDGYRARDFRPTSRPSFTVTEKIRSWQVRLADGRTHRPTVEEAAVLQGFSSCTAWLAESATARFHQVANATPPPLAAACWQAVLGEVGAREGAVA